MSDVVIKGNASGTGSVTIESPNTNSNFTLTLPTETGTVLTNNGNQAGTFSSLTVNSNNISADNSMGFRNRIINGDMRIDQRNAGAAVTTNGAYAVDRFLIQNNTDGAFSAQQDSSAPTGFINSTKFTTTTADGTLTTDQRLIVRQMIEGTNVSDLAFGTASAKTVTLSFWVRSSLTGAFGGSLSNSANDRSYPFTYTISVADTWEPKSVTIPGDTTGTWLTTTGVGIRVCFSLGSGPDRSGTAGSWSASQLTSATGATSVIGTLNATFYITGVQLEVGSVATPFERRPYGTELALCQRYYYRMVADNSFSQFGLSTSRGSTQSEGLFPLPVTMRVAPTLLDYSTLMLSIAAGASNTPVTAATINSGSNNKYVPNVTFTVGANFGSAGQALQVLANNSTSAYIGFGAEL
jgi:hypothetical protein